MYALKSKLPRPGGGRSLTTDIEKINLDDDSITWHYSATKESETKFNYGATSDSLLPKDGIVTLSQGDWSIGLWGIKDGKKVYAGTTSNVTIKWNFYEPNVTVPVTVKQNTGDYGYIVLTDVKIPVNDNLETPNFASIDSTIIMNFNGVNMRLECIPGPHTVTFEYRSDNGDVLSSKSLVVEVISGRETTISGNIDKSEITSGSSSLTEVKQAIEVKKEGDTVVNVLVAPANTSSNLNQTTVTFPQGALPEEATTAVLNLSVKSAGEFTVSSTNTHAVAGIDISLKVNEQEVTSFNNEYVVITTYILAGLESVQVNYNGTDGDQPIASSAGTNNADILTSSSPASALGYNPSTGLLRFKTNHFSEYYVLSNCVSVNITTNVGYDDLQEAFSNAQDGDIIKLVDNITSNTGFLFDNNAKVTFDLNQKTLKVKQDSDNNSRAVKVKLGTLIIKNGIIDARNVDENGNPKAINVQQDASEAEYQTGMYGAIRVEDGAKLELDRVVLYNNHCWGLSLKIAKGAFATVKNCTFNSDVGGAIEVAGGKANISATKFNQTNLSIKFNYISCCISVSYDGVANIEDSEVLASGYHALYVFNSGGTINVKDGTFTANGNDGKVIQVDATTNATSTVNVLDGTFRGKLGISGSGARLIIKGGTFSANPSSYLAQDYGVIKQDDQYKVAKLPKSDDGVYTIENAEELILFANMVNECGNSFSGKTINLEDNIDLSGVTWKPVGQTGATQFQGLFDGNNHTIKNLRIDNNDESDNCASGLFGWLNNAIVKNLTIDGANVTGHHNVGVIAGYLETSGCTIENCHVNNATVSCTSVNSEANGDKCGGIVGHAGNEGVVVKNCTVSDTTISAGRDAGQVVGAAKELYVTDCSATNVTVTANGTSTGANINNEVIGRVLK